MATYIQGLTDYIPQIQPFKRDLNFYSKVLQMSQDKYDAAKREIGTLYGSLLYSPLTRQNNIQRRDDFFKNDRASDKEDIRNGSVTGTEGDRIAFPLSIHEEGKRRHRFSVQLRYFRHFVSGILYT